MKKFQFLIFIAAIIVFTGAFYLYRTNSQSSPPESVSPNIQQSTNSSNIQPPQVQASSPSPKPQTIEESQKDISASLNSTNYQDLKQLMADQINLVFMSTDCCGPVTAQEATGELVYISGGEPFNFNQQNATIQNLKAKNPRLAGAYIGISQSGEQLAAFKFDNSNKIISVELAISYNLYSL